MVFKSSSANSVNPVTKAGTKAPLFICYSCLQKQRQEETRQRHPPYPPLISSSLRTAIERFMARSSDTWQTLAKLRFCFSVLALSFSLSLSLFLSVYSKETLIRISAGLNHSDGVE